MSAIELHGKIEPVQLLPLTETPVDLRSLDTWEDLQEHQQLYLCSYFVVYPKRLSARMQTGVSQNKLNEWFKRDKNFAQAFAEIEELHKENLSAIHYNEAYHDSRTRKDVLKGIGARGYDSEKSKTNTTNILNVGDVTMSQLADALKKS